MSSNPLFPPDTSQDGRVEDPAVNLIRSKVQRAYGAEPDAAQELAEVKHERVLSKHQRYMQELGASGKSLAEIQTEWHHYYTTLGDAEKHEVWDEFYQANQNTPYQKLFQKQKVVVSRQQLVESETKERAGSSRQPVTTASAITVADHEPVAAGRRKHSTRPASTTGTRKLKAKIVDTVSANGKLTVKHHLQSLAFGLGAGFLTLLILLFTFFNDRIIAPFIQPSRTVGNAPIILSDSQTAVNAPPSITIPKINVQIPLVFDVPTVEENAVEAGLKRGVVHYANTAMPGQNGNGAYFGHSAVNIFNNGEKYGFAFTLLHNLTTGDVFYITYSGKTYAYRVFQREVVPPTQVSVINDSLGKQATVTLITCDPPGVSTNRLVLWGEQISPAPSTNTTATAETTTVEPASIAGNGPTLWSRFVNTIEFWN